jgi:phosphate transport system substrate-binding protein
MVNKDGHKVSPSLESFRAAAEDTDWMNPPRLGASLVNRPGAAAWPITGVSFILMRSQPSNSAATARALRFFEWALENGGKVAEDLDYIPMPPETVSKIRRLWGEIRDGKGNPLYDIPQ